jgi:capsular polysaccharide biosynthesis protein
MILESRESDSFAEDTEGQFVPSVGDLLRPIWQRFWLIVLAMSLCVGVAVGFSLIQTPVYEASIKILVGQKQGIIQDPAQADGLQQLTLTLSEAVATRPVVQPVIEKFSLEKSPGAVIESMSVEPVADTQFIEVSYRDTNPERAQQVVNEIGNELSEQISEVSPNVNAITANVWEEALVPASPVSPNPLVNGVLAAVIGGILGVGLAFLLDYRDPSWRSPEEAEKISGVPTFGVIPQFEGSKGTMKWREDVFQAAAQREEKDESLQ